MWALRYLWALVSPIFGPVFGAARGLLPGFNLGSVIVPAMIAIGLGLIAWQGYRIATADRPAMVTVDDVRANRLEAENRALKAALAQREETLREREAEMERELEGLASKLKAMELARNASRETNIHVGVPVLDASDPWMQSKR